METTLFLIIVIAAAIVCCCCLLIAVIISKRNKNNEAKDTFYENGDVKLGEGGFIYEQGNSPRAEHVVR